MIEVQGADQLAKLSATLRGLAGANGVQKEFNQALARAVKPLKANVKRSALANLPSRGGLAAEIAAARLTTRRSNNKKGAGLRLVAKGHHSLYHLDQGIVRHRKGGNITGGKVQRIEPGWWTRPTEESAPEVRKAVLAAMEAVVKKIDHSV